jgi:predicted transcriptional regulator
MANEIITLRLPPEQLAALDKLAAASDRDRSYLLNEAVTTYLQVQEWQLEQIKGGIAEADAGKVMEHAKVRQTASKWRRGK